MSGFSDSVLEKKLTELNNSQQSIQTLSLWLIHHRKHHAKIVQVWFKELKKAKPNRKLTFMYLANDVIQNSKKKGPEFNKEFIHVLGAAFAHVHKSVSDAKTKRGLDRIINVWEERNVYDFTVINGFRIAMKESSEAVKNTDSTSEKIKLKSSKKKSQATGSEPSENGNSKETAKQELETPQILLNPPDSDELIKVLETLENMPSCDAVVRGKIASLPREVADVSLLENIKTRQAADKLAKQVDEADALLTDYNRRLSEELDERKRASSLIKEYLHYQREKLNFQEEQLKEYKEKLKQMEDIQEELDSHLQNLPDMSRLPNVTGGLAPLPSAGDLFNLP